MDEIRRVWTCLLFSLSCACAAAGNRSPEASISLREAGAVVVRESPPAQPLERGASRAPSDGEFEAYQLVRRQREAASLALRATQPAAEWSARPAGAEAQVSLAHFMEAFPVLPCQAEESRSRAFGLAFESVSEVELALERDPLGEPSQRPGADMMRLSCSLPLGSGTALVGSVTAARALDVHFEEDILDPDYLWVGLGLIHRF